EQNSIKKRSKIFASTYDSIFDKLAAGDGKNIGKEDYAALDKKIASLEKSAEKGKVSASIVKEWKDAKIALEAYVAAELKYRVEDEKAKAASTVPATKGSAAWTNAENARKTAAKALSSEISANAAYEASVNGIGVAWSKTKERVKDAVAKDEMGKV
ncbi:hypothetical protein RXP18_28795, partial [Pseudomonas aeruginosa]|nr:hypothetical protein [Pseudomonas aeruginosa]